LNFKKKVEIIVIIMDSLKGQIAKIAPKGVDEMHDDDITLFRAQVFALVRELSSKKPKKD
jgi:hypothetical protein